MRRLFLFISVGMMALQLGCANSGAENLRPELAALKEELTTLKTTVQTLNEALAGQDSLAQKVQFLEAEVTAAKDSLSVLAQRIVYHRTYGHLFLTARRLTIQDDVGKDLIDAGAATSGHGMLGVYNKDGKDLIHAGASDNGAGISLYNKTGEEIIQLRADDYGNGVVGAYNRKGKGRTLESK